MENKLRVGNGLDVGLDWDLLVQLVEMRRRRRGWGGVPARPAQIAPNIVGLI
jgi:hypothetical protein